MNISVCCVQYSGLRAMSTTFAAAEISRQELMAYVNNVDISHLLRVHFDAQRNYRNMSDISFGYYLGLRNRTQKNVWIISQRAKVFRCILKTTKRDGVKKGSANRQRGPFPLPILIHCKYLSHYSTSQNLYLKLSRAVDAFYIQRLHISSSLIHVMSICWFEWRQWLFLVVKVHDRITNSMLTFEMNRIAT